jgi:hypothetical protein
MMVLIVVAEIVICDCDCGCSLILSNDDCGSDIAVGPHAHIGNSVAVDC